MTFMGRSLEVVDKRGCCRTMIHASGNAPDCKSPYPRRNPLALPAQADMQGQVHRHPHGNGAQHHLALPTAPEEERHPGGSGE